MGRDRRRGWKRPLASALKIGVSCGLLFWVLHKTNLASVGHALASASPAWLALGLALGFAATMVQATQWQRLLLAVGLDRSITRSLRIVFVGNTFNTVLPSSIGGDAARAMYIAERPGERPQGVVAVVLQRLLNFPGMVLLIGLGLAFTITNHAAARARPEAAAGAVLGLAILGVALSPVLGRIGTSTSFSRLPGWKSLSASLRVLDGFRSQRADLAAAVGRGVVFWSLTVLNQWCFIRAMGIHLTPGYAALSVTLVNGLTMLPISINGFGAREGGFTALLGVPGLATTAQAVSVGLMVGAQSLLFGLIGAGCLLTLKSTARWARQVETAAAALVTVPSALAGVLNVRRLIPGTGRRGGHHQQPESTAEARQP